MKTRFSLLTILLLFFLSHTSAQRVNNLVVFCNEGERFTLILNGERYNSTPATKVRATDLVLASYKVKIIFENPRISDHNTTLTFYRTNKECVFGLMKKSKRKYSMDYVSETNIEPVAEPVPQVAEPEPVPENTNTETYTSTPVSTPPVNSNNSNSISLNTGGINIGVNEDGSIKLGTKEGAVNMNTKDKGGNVVINDGNNGIVINKAPAKTGCPTAMSSAEFEAIKKSVSNQTSDDTKLTTATTLLEGNCFSTSQVKQVMQTFTNDKTKLEFAKNAYPYTHDISNYNLLKDGLSTEESKKELQTFVKEQKK